MKKIFILLLTVGFTASVSAQKYFTKTGHVWFYSHAPLEDIEAHNYQVSSIVDAATGEVVFTMLMKGFQFEKALMQEHFNEKYVHSDKFPKSEFKGKVTNLDKIDFSKDGTYEAEVTGDLTIHGVTKPLTTKGTIEKKGEKVFVKSKFPVTVADYDIEIPAAVRENIAKVVDVTVDLEYAPYNK